MNLLDKLLHYCENTLPIRNNLIKRNQKLKKDFDSKISLKNNDLTKIEDELKKIVNDIIVCKNDIKTKIATIYQQKAYNEFLSSIDSFNLESSLITGNRTNESELEKVKDKLISLLTLEKSIVSTRIPQIEKKKNRK